MMVSSDGQWSIATPVSCAWMHSHHDQQEASSHYVNRYEQLMALVPTHREASAIYRASTIQVQDVAQKDRVHHIMYQPRSIR